MINIVTMFANPEKQKELELDLTRNNIRFVAGDFANADEFLNAFNEINVNIDAAVISDDCLNGTDKKEFFETVRFSEPNIRIIIVFTGYRNQYIEEQIKEYKESMKVDDIIYEGNGIESDYLIQIIKKGYIYDYDINVYDEDDNEEKQITTSHKCVSIGVMGVTHGCGVTNMAVNIANYISISENAQVRAIDFTDTGSLRFAKGRKVTFLVHSGIDTARIMRTSRAVVYDMGTPFNISSKGKLIENNACWSQEKISLFKNCDLKICMGFADSWHIGKVKYFWNDRQWKREMNESYLFLFDRVPEKLKAHSKVNIYQRNDKAVEKYIAALFDTRG